MSIVEPTDDDPVLEWRFDDQTDPREVTVYDPLAEDPTTAWITTAATDTVAVEDAL